MKIYKNYIPIINDPINPYYCLDGGVIFIFKVPSKNYKFEGKASIAEVSRKY